MVVKAEVYLNQYNQILQIRTLIGWKTIIFLKDRSIHSNQNKTKQKSVTERKYTVMVLYNNIK